MSLVAAAALLFPVALDDPLLRAGDTYVSPVLAAAIAGDSGGQAHCMTLPEGSASHRTVCMATAEWQAVFDRIEANEAADNRMRAIWLAQWYARS